MLKKIQMLKKKKEAAPKSGLVEQVVVETAPVVAKKTSLQILNEPIAEKPSPGHSSRDFSKSSD